MYARPVEQIKLSFAKTASNIGRAFGRRRPRQAERFAGGRSLV